MTRLQNEAFQYFINERNNQDGKVAKFYQMALEALDPKPRTLVIECAGGVVQDVYGMPQDWTYEIADHDDDDESHIGGLIAKAKAQN